MEMRIVVASDGQPAALGALHVARALAERHGAAVEVVGAVPPILLMPSYVGAPTVLPLVELDQANLEAARAQLHRQVAALGGAAAAWPITVEPGPAAPTIVRLARERNASLIVLGHGRHSLADRWLGTETALQVVRIAHVPVLAVPAEARELPTTALAAVDFTEFSRDAAETTLLILQPGGTLHLVHVLWMPAAENPWVGGRDWIETHRQTVQSQLDQLARELGRSSGVKVETHLLEGDAAGETRRLAKTLGADLIAAGSHGTGFFGRVLMGSVSTRLLRGATGMVLIAPPRDIPGELEPGREGDANTAMWSPGE